MLLFNIRNLVVITYSKSELADFELGDIMSLNKTVIRLRIIYKLKISAAGNTEVPSYLALIKLGYEVSKNAESKLWFAVKADTELVADSPLELLALVKLFEVRGENWKASDSEIDSYLKTYE